MFKWLFGNKDGGTTAGGTAETVVVSRKFKATPEKAFAAFVDAFDTWWPRDKKAWGTVLSIHRPEHIVVAWQIGPKGALESSEATSSRLDIRFVALDPETTEVIVVHRDFPRHGDGWQAYRASMAAKAGWPQIMEAYAKALSGG